MPNLKSDAAEYFSRLKQFISTNRKAKTIKQIGKELSIPVEFLEKFFDTLYSTDYFKCRKSPTGRFIRAIFNEYSTKIYYRCYNYGLEKGRLVIGDNRNIFYTLREYEKRDLAELEDKARRDNVFYVHSTLSLEVFVKIFTKEMGLTFEEVEGTAPTDEFKNFPLVKAEIEKYSKLLESLQKEVQEEIALNEKNAKWYEEERYKASIGKRRKDEPYSVKVGEDRIVGVEYNRYWFDDDPVMSYTESFVPKYETRYRSVVDWPEKPEPRTDAQFKNNPRITQYQYHIQNLSDNRILYEKKLKEDQEKAAKIAELEKQKQEIEKQIRAVR